MENWINSNNKDIVLSSRIRLARNIKDIAFPHKLDSEQGKLVVKKIEDAFYNSDICKYDFKTINLWENDLNYNKLFFEKHLISYKLLKNMNKSSFILNKDETVSIMVNEEDHLRLQCISSGLNLEETFDFANSFDDLLEESIDYAFDEQFGYLTTCPTNSGTGLRASVMLHLPGLSMQKEMDKIFNTVSQIGMTIRGLYGEGSKGLGNLYQISNQVTLGLEEHEIINNLVGVVKQIINQEQYARDRIMKKYKYEIMDKVYRSLGLLKTAYLLQTDETLRFLSNVRLGIELGIIDTVEIKTINELLIGISEASLQIGTEDELSKRELAVRRANFVQEKLKK